MKHFRLVLLLMLALPATILAQLGSFDNVLRGTSADAKLLAEGYIKPFMRGYGYGLNQGWYNTGAPHKLGGFDLTLTTSIVQIPTADQTYGVDNSKLTNVELMNGATPATGVVQVPSAFGGKALAAPTYRSPKGTGTTFQGPAGLGIKFLPVPALGLGVGLPKGFELKLRYIPTVDFSKFYDKLTGNLDLFGIGVVHDFKQWIPGVKALPFDMSVFVGYTKMKLEVGWDATDKTKKGSFTSSATTIQALISKKVSVLTVYGGLGMNIAKTEVGVKGSYDLNNNGNTTDAGEKDPFTIAADSNGARATVGIRLRFAVIAFHADYTIQKYSAITGGFGINFR